MLKFRPLLFVAECVRTSRQAASLGIPPYIAQIHTRRFTGTTSLVVERSPSNGSIAGSIPDDAIILHVLYFIFFRNKLRSGLAMLIILKFYCFFQNYFFRAFSLL